MKHIMIGLVVVLSGCTSTVVPLIPKFPEPPGELLTSCPDLKELAADTDRLSMILSVVSENYGQYHQCRLKNDTWREWYQAQRRIWDDK